MSRLWMLLLPVIYIKAPRGTTFHPRVPPKQRPPEARKIVNYRELSDYGYVLQPAAVEVQVSLGVSIEISSRL